MDAGRPEALVVGGHHDHPRLEQGPEVGDRTEGTERRRALIGDTGRPVGPAHDRESAGRGRPAGYDDHSGDGDVGPRHRLRVVEHPVGGGPGGEPSGRADHAGADDGTGRRRPQRHRNLVERGRGGGPLARPGPGRCPRPSGSTVVLDGDGDGSVLRTEAEAASDVPHPVSIRPAATAATTAIRRPPSALVRRSPCTLPPARLPTIPVHASHPLPHCASRAAVRARSSTLSVEWTPWTWWPAGRWRPRPWASFPSTRPWPPGGGGTGWIRWDRSIAPFPGRR